jgi:hypothetical protein
MNAVGLHMTPAPQGTILPGTTIQLGRFTVVIDRYIAEGGFAHVYVGSILNNGAIVSGFPVVIKRIAVADKERLAVVNSEIETMVTHWRLQPRRLFASVAFLLPFIHNLALLVLVIIVPGREEARVLLYALPCLELTHFPVFNCLFCGVETSWEAQEYCRVYGFVHGQAGAWRIRSSYSHGVLWR